MRSIINLVHTADRFICRQLNKLFFYFRGVRCTTALSNINGLIHIAGPGEIVIGPGTRMNSGARFNPIGGDSRLNLVVRKKQSAILIGDNCGLSNCTIVADTTITIQHGALIGGGVKIYDTDFHALTPESRLGETPGQPSGQAAPVTIGRNAFIGAHSILLKGVTIGDNSVVGAGSVVSRDVPPGEIWAGNPARFLRTI